MPGIHVLCYGNFTGVHVRLLLFVEMKSLWMLGVGVSSSMATFFYCRDTEGEGPGNVEALPPGFRLVI